jgi:F-type H+-transporting ATPase subunit b
MSSALVATQTPVLALSGGVTLDFDNTVVFQIAIFVILMFVLEPLLFQPVLRIFAAREERTEGAKAKARELEEKAGELLRRYEREIERVNRVAAEERDRLRTETTKLEADILREAREASARIVEDGRRRSAEEVARVRFDLGKESEKISQELVGRVLGGRGGS